jgi:3-isopropylmalate dehydrogenase
MMLDHVGLAEAAQAVETAVVACLEAGECTQDVGGKLGTAATGDAVTRRLREVARVAR